MPDPSRAITRLDDAELGLPEVRSVIGERNALSVAEALNEFVAPEAKACIAAAHEHDPEVAGKLALRFVLEADPEGGSVVGDMETVDDNEILDEELLACIHESVGQAVFPEPTGADPEYLALSLMVTPLSG